jgi:4-amino-4-deoxy-L-arabinose transferase-like glycosyltransferase
VGTLARDLRRPLASADAVRVRPLLRSPATAAVAGLVVLATFLRFGRIGHQGFWFDEANTALLVNFSPGKMLGLIPQTESTPPLYYCVAWVWARIFGSSEVGLRSLSALAGVLTVPLAYGVGAKFISRRAGVILAALCACNPLLIWYSQEARAYSMLVLLSTAALLAFAYARERPTTRVLGAWVVASCLALTTHYYALLAIAPQAAWLLVVHRRRRPVQVAVGLVALCGLALIPLAISQNGTGRADWISRYPLDRRLGAVVPQFLIGFGSPAYGVLEPLAVAIAVFALLLVLTRCDVFERRRALVAGGLAISGLVLNLSLIAVGIDDLIARNLITIWMPAAAAVAVGFAASRARVVGLLGPAALCAIGIVAAAGVASERKLERPDWRVVANVLGARPTAVQGRAIFIQHYRDLLPLSLYLPKLTGISKNGAAVTELDIVSFSSPPSGGFCWWGSACNLWPSRMQRSYPIRGFHVVRRRQALQFTILRMVSDRPTLVTRREVSRVLTTTRFRNDELLLQR